MHLQNFRWLLVVVFAFSFLLTRSYAVGRKERDVQAPGSLGLSDAPPVYITARRGLSASAIFGVAAFFCVFLSLSRDRTNFGRFACVGSLVIVSLGAFYHASTKAPLACYFIVVLFSPSLAILSAAVYISDSFRRPDLDKRVAISDIEAMDVGTFDKALVFCQLLCSSVFKDPSNKNTAMLEAVASQLKTALANLDMLKDLATLKRLDDFQTALASVSHEIAPFIKNSKVNDAVLLATDILHQIGDVLIIKDVLKLEVTDNQSFLAFLKALHSILVDPKNAAKINPMSPKIIAALRLVMDPMSKITTLNIASSFEEAELLALFGSLHKLLCKELDDIVESVKKKLIPKVVSLGRSVDKDVLAKFLARNNLSTHSALPTHAAFLAEFEDHLRKVHGAVDDDVDNLNKLTTLLTAEYIELVKSIPPFKNALEKTIKHIELHGDLLSTSALQVKGVDVDKLLNYFELMMHRVSLTKKQAAKASMIGKIRLIVAELKERSERDFEATGTADDQDILDRLTGLIAKLEKYDGMTWKVLDLTHAAKSDSILKDILATLRQRKRVLENSHATLPESIVNMIKTFSLPSDIDVGAVERLVKIKKDNQAKISVNSLDASVDEALAARVFENINAAASSATADYLAIRSSLDPYSSPFAGIQPALDVIGAWKPALTAYAHAKKDPKDTAPRDDGHYLADLEALAALQKLNTEDISTSIGKEAKAIIARFIHYLEDLAKKDVLSNLLTGERVSKLTNASLGISDGSDSLYKQIEDIQAARTIPSGRTIADLTEQLKSELDLEQVNVIVNMCKTLYTDLSQDAELGAFFDAVIKRMQATDTSIAQNVVGKQNAFDEFIKISRMNTIINSCSGINETFWDSTFQPGALPTLGKGADFLDAVFALEASLPFEDKLKDLQAWIDKFVGAKIGSDEYGSNVASVLCALDQELSGDKTSYANAVLLLKFQAQNSEIRTDSAKTLGNVELPKAKSSKSGYESELLEFKIKLFDKTEIIAYLQRLSGLEMEAEKDSDKNAAEALERILRPKFSSAFPKKGVDISINAKFQEIFKTDVGENVPTIKKVLSDMKIDYSNRLGNSPSDPVSPTTTPLPNTKPKNTGGGGFGGSHVSHHGASLPSSANFDPPTFKTSLPKTAASVSGGPDPKTTPNPMPLPNIKPKNAGEGGGSGGSYVSRQGGSPPSSTSFDPLIISNISTLKSLPPNPTTTHPLTKSTFGGPPPVSIDVHSPPESTPASIDLFHKLSLIESSGIRVESYYVPFINLHRSISLKDKLAPIEKQMSDNKTLDITTIESLQPIFTLDIINSLSSEAEGIQDFFTRAIQYCIKQRDMLFDSESKELPAKLAELVSLFDAFQSLLNICGAQIVITIPRDREFVVPEGIVSLPMDASLVLSFRTSTVNEKQYSQAMDSFLEKFNLLNTFNPLDAYNTSSAVTEISLKKTKDEFMIFRSFLIPVLEDKTLKNTRMKLSVLFVKVIRFINTNAPDLAIERAYPYKVMADCYKSLAPTLWEQCINADALCKKYNFDVYLTNLFPTEKDLLISEQLENLNTEFGKTDFHFSQICANIKLYEDVVAVAKFLDANKKLGLSTANLEAFNRIKDLYEEKNMQTTILDRLTGEIQDADWVIGQLKETIIVLDSKFQIPISSKNEKKFMDFIAGLILRKLSSLQLSEDCSDDYRTTFLRLVSQLDVPIVCHFSAQFHYFLENLRFKVVCASDGYLILKSLRTRLAKKLGLAKTSEDNVHLKSACEVYLKAIDLEGGTLPTLAALDAKKENPLEEYIDDFIKRLCHHMESIQFNKHPRNADTLLIGCSPGILKDERAIKAINDYFATIVTAIYSDRANIIKTANFPDNIKLFSRLLDCFDASQRLLQKLGVPVKITLWIEGNVGEYLLPPDNPGLVIASFNPILIGSYETDVIRLIEAMTTLVEMNSKLQETEKFFDIYSSVFNPFLAIPDVKKAMINFFDKVAEVVNEQKKVLKALDFTKNENAILNAQRLFSLKNLIKDCRSLAPGLWKANPSSQSLSIDDLVDDRMPLLKEAFNTSGDTIGKLTRLYEISGEVGSQHDPEVQSAWFDALRDIEDGLSTYEDVQKMGILSLSNNIPGMDISASTKWNQVKKEQEAKILENAGKNIKQESFPSILNFVSEVDSSLKLPVCSTTEWEFMRIIATKFNAAMHGALNSTIPPVSSYIENLEKRCKNPYQFFSAQFFDSFLKELIATHLKQCTLIRLDDVFPIIENTLSTYSTFDDVIAMYYFTRKHFSNIDIFISETWKKRKEETEKKFISTNFSEVENLKRNINNLNSKFSEGGKVFVSTEALLKRAIRKIFQDLLSLDSPNYRSCATPRLILSALVGASIDNFSEKFKTDIKNFIDTLITLTVAYLNKE